MRSMHIIKPYNKDERLILILRRRFPLSYLLGIYAMLTIDDEHIYMEGWWKGMIPLGRVDCFHMYELKNGRERLTISIKENFEWNEDLKKNHAAELEKGTLELSVPYVREVGVVLSAEDQNTIKVYLTQRGLPIRTHPYGPETKSGR